MSVAERMKTLFNKNSVEIVPYMEAQFEKFEKVLGLKEIIKDGDLFEEFVAFLFGQGRKGYERYMTTSEHSEENGKGNSGVDIIFPWANNLVIIAQVKSKLEKDRTKGYKILETRGKNFFKAIQAKDANADDISEEWKIDVRVIKNIIKNKEFYKPKYVWIELSDNHERTKLENFGVECWGIPELTQLHINIQSPFEYVKTFSNTFKVTSVFSDEENKSILIKKDEKVVSLVAPVQLKQLIDFMNTLKKEEIEHIFTQNVRDFQGKTRIFKGIMETIKDKPGEFYLQNNGLTIISNEITYESIVSNVEYELSGIQVINGQQTLWAIWNYVNDVKKGKKKRVISDDAFVLLRAYVINNVEQIRRIAASTNTQKYITPVEIYASHEIHRKIFDALRKKAILYKFRGGASTFSKQFRGWPTIKISDLLKYWAIYKGEHVWAKNQKGQIMEIFANRNGDKGVQFKSVADSFDKLENENKKTKKNQIEKTLSPLAVKIVKLRKYKSKLAYSEALDMFSFFFFKNEAQAVSFIDGFNVIARKAENKIKPNGTATNIANVFKSKAHSGDLFKEMKKEWKAHKKSKS